MEFSDFFDFSSYVDHFGPNGLQVEPLHEQPKQARIDTNTPLVVL